MKMLDGKLLDVDGAITQYKNTVYKEAHNYNKMSPYYISFEDLAQEGFMGLVVAYEKFDEGRNQFLTYAIPYIQNYMKNYINNFTQLGVPRDVARIARSIKARKIVNEPIEKLMEILDVSEKRITNALFYLGIEVKNGESRDGEGVLFDFAKTESDFTKLEIEPFMRTLTPKRQKILTLLIEGYGPNEIAESLNCSEQNIQFVKRLIRAKYKEFEMA